MHLCDGTEKCGLLKTCRPRQAPSPVPFSFRNTKGQYLVAVRGVGGDGRFQREMSLIQILLCSNLKKMWLLKNNKSILSRTCLNIKHMQPGESRSNDRYQQPLTWMARHQSLATVTIVFTAGLSSALASSDTSTSNNLSHSKQKTEPIKRVAVDPPGEW